MRPSIAVLAAFATACLACTASAQPSSDPGWMRDPATGCAFLAPGSAAGPRVHWTGDCPGGRADGLGMLRRRDGDTPGPAFFGEMRRGVPVIGVVELPGGYELGRYRDGGLGARSIEFQERIDAFRTAARAARAVAARYAVAGNPGSAAFYERTATTLDEQEE